MATQSAVIDRRRAIGDAVAFHQAGRLAEAERAYRAIVAVEPHHFDALHLLGVVLMQQGDNDEAAALIARALKRNPRSFDALYNLGIALNTLGRHKEAVGACCRAVGLNPKHVMAHNNLGVALHGTDRFEDAAASYRCALAFAPDCAEAHYNLANALLALKRHEEAIASYRRALAIKPDYAEAYNNLGAALHELHRYDEAIGCLRQALVLRPDFADALNTLGRTLLILDRCDEASRYFRKALTIQPSVETYGGLGYTLLRTGRGLEAVAAYRHALDMNPARAEVHSDLIYALDFIPDAGFEEQQAERRNWYEKHGKRFAGEIRRHVNDRDPDRKLRIGYVSADFNHHSPALAFGPVLRNHDRSQFDLFLYSGVKIENDDTQSFREMATGWRDTNALSDEALATQIRHNRIDILIDLAGQSYGNRLLAFARKPAPVQVTAWGYATGTGVSTIDYFLADSVSVPESARPLFAETIYDLPCIIGYAVPDYAPDVKPPPCTLGRPTTFGCLNRLNKIADGVVALWSRLLHELPTSRLLLKDGQLSDSGECRRMRNAFATHGIDAGQLILLPRTTHAEHLAAFAEVDIALDPFPTTGGISTLEALSMGVPVVTLLGNSIPSRVGGAIVSAAGLGQWVAETGDEYIALAKRHAADPASLAELRQHLRPSLKASPLGDPVKYSRAVEDAYRSMWRKFCET
jgi:predicted O-linked N-acetylglucosamine transferase (SPINDLY family)